MKKGTLMSNIKKSTRRIKISSLALALAAISALAAAQLPTQSGEPLLSLQKTKQIPAFAGPLQTERSFNRLIIKFKAASSTRAGVFDARAAENNVATLSASTQASNSDAVGLSLLKSVTPKTHVALTDKNLNRAELFALAKQLEQDPAVEYAEIDEPAYPQLIPNDPDYALKQWHYQAPSSFVGGVNLPLAWDSATGSGVVVAVIDTGYRPHADLAANLLAGYDFITDTLAKTNGGGLGSDGLDPGDWTTANQCSTGSTATPSSWHGTHVAGTIAAVTNNGVGVAGVAFNAKILPVRVLGVCGGLTSDIAAGMRWAAGLTVPGVPANLNKAKVLNLSLGGTTGVACSQTYQDAVTAVRAAGSVVVAATGNDGARTISAPANCTGVIAVTAHTKSGDNASYANIGAGTTISAPGGGQGVINTAQTGSIDVYSTLNTGTTTPVADSYGLLHGTSQATSHVAGVAALLASLQPAISPDTVASILTNSARVHPAGTYCSGRTDCGAGLLDAKAAIDRLNSLAPTVSASAGTGVKPTGSTVTLTGTTTTPGGSPIASYLWTQLTGPTVTLSGSTSSSASFVAPSIGNTFSFSLKVTDAAGLAASGQVSLTSNSAPVLAPIASHSVVLGQSVSFTASATDAENNPIVYVASGLPAGSTLDPATGIFTWNNAGPVGSYSFTITPNDGTVNGTSQTVSISVSALGGGGGGGGGGALTAWDLIGLVALLTFSLAATRRRSTKK